MSDIEIPAELVQAQREAEAARQAVGAWTEADGDTLADRWAAASAAAEKAHALRAALVAEHGSFAVTYALGLAVQEEPAEAG
jgi:hypothetical protein